MRAFAQAATSPDRVRLSVNAMTENKDSGGNADVHPSGEANAMRDETAQRALSEARARRAAIDAATRESEGERGGRGGLDPARYGDWEIKGVASDF